MMNIPYQSVILYSNTIPVPYSIVLYHHIHCEVRALINNMVVMVTCELSRVYGCSYRSS